MRQIILVVVLSVFVFTGCSGTNQYLNNKNVMGTVGGVGGGVLGNKLCRGCNKTTKLISTIGGVLGGLWLGSTTGEFFDKRDRERQVKLIEDTLEKNKDYQTSTDTYKKSNWVNPNTGQQENVVAQNQVTPMRTYQPQPQRNVYLQNDIRQSQTYNLNQQRQTGQFCREYTVDVKISKELTGSIQDHKTQYFHSCRSVSGWRTIQQSYNRLIDLIPLVSGLFFWSRNSIYKVVQGEYIGSIRVRVLRFSVFPNQKKIYSIFWGQNLFIIIRPFCFQSNPSV